LVIGILHIVITGYTKGKNRTNQNNPEGGIAPGETSMPYRTAFG